jgi:hypothetical protein
MYNLQPSAHQTWTGTTGSVECGGQMWSILTLRVPPQRLSKFYKVKRFKLNLGLKHKTNATFMDGKLYNDLSLSGLNPHMSGSFICVTSVRGQEKGT